MESTCEMLLEQLVRAFYEITAQVAFHKYKMMEQLRLKTGAELVQFAVKEGVVA